MSEKQNNIHPARSFVRGFAVGCLVLSGVFALVNDRARDLWPTVNVREVALDEETLLVNRAFDVLRNEFYRDIEDEDVYTFIDGALKSLDPNSGFVEPGVLSVMQGRSDEDQASPEPSFVLGIFWAATSSDFTIQAVVPDSPADRVGLRPGDVLLSVDGEDVSHLSGPEAYTKMSQIMDMNRGEEMTLEIRRGLEQFQSKVMAEQRAPSFVYDLGQRDGVPHIVVSAFYTGVTQDLKTLLSRTSSNGECRAVLDVRSNGGGLVSEVEAMAQMFAPHDTLIYTTRSRIAGVEEFRTEGVGEFYGCRVAVLINEESASASEILAGFFQANKLGAVVGQTSYGKGSVQDVVPLGQAHGAVRVTIGYYTDAAGRQIEGKGVYPDIYVEGLENTQRPNFGSHDEALDQARSWVLSDEEVGNVPTSKRPALLLEEAPL